MMRKLGLAIAMAVGLLFAGSAAQAAVVTEDIGTLDAGHPFGSFGYNLITSPNFKLDNSGQGTFKVTFALGNISTDTAASLTATAVQGTALKSFTFGLYDSANALLAQVDQTSAFHPGNGSTTFSFLDFANLLKEGSYYLLLTVTAGNAGQHINGNINVAAVPIPAALPMFGLVLLGLAAFQMRRRQNFSV